MTACADDNVPAVVDGDIVALARTGATDVLVHECNCDCVMGAGVAKAIRAAFPEAYSADRATVRGDRTKLGTCSSARIAMDSGCELVVVNAYTQATWRGRGVKVDYDALRACFEWVQTTFAGLRIAYPAIGAGLGGGDWRRIAPIIERALAGERHFLVRFGVR